MFNTGTVMRKVVIHNQPGESTYESEYKLSFGFLGNFIQSTQWKYMKCSSKEKFLKPKLLK
jgi:hypothetical protein